MDAAIDLKPPESYWHASAPAAMRRSDELPAAADVVVIGGGLLGASTAYWLARAGAAAVLIEQGALAAGATGRNGGFMVAGTAERYPAAIARLGHATAREIWQLTLDSRALLRHVLAEEAIDCDYREPGNLELALGEEQLAELSSTIAALRADGFVADLLDRSQVQSLIDTPLAPAIAGGLFAPENGLLHPARLVYGLAGAAERHGARIVSETLLTGIVADGDGVLARTTRGDIRAGAAVIAANAWLGQIVPALSERVTPVRGQALAFEPIPQVFQVGLGAALTPTGEYWQQAPDGTVVLGGCRAVAPGRDVGIRDSRPTPEVQAALERVLPQLFPALAGLRVARRWAGPMAFTSDYLPIADRAPELARVWVVGGFCGHGMPFGMRLGQLLAHAATSDERPAALAPFRIERMTMTTG
ncbi:MAG TPA: FAD-binding oxidoreductase [Roseiflexaceae bacterium]|nr:FAD-binding oxidoreductase [Roseiflexaceae bacterium]